MHSLVLGDDPAAWRRLGFAVSGGTVVVGGVALRCTGSGGGVLSWVLAGPGEAPSIDGLPTAWEPAPALDPAAHPNGASAVDHVVVLTDDRSRTATALERAGGSVRRRADPPAVPAPMAFVRLGGVIVEVAQAGGPPRFWGLVVVVPDVDGLARSLGSAVGSPRDAVQPGRRIVTARAAPGLQTALAFITPRPGFEPVASGGQEGPTGGKVP